MHGLVIRAEFNRCLAKRYEHICGNPSKIGSIASRRSRSLTRGHHRKLRIDLVSMTSH